MKSWSVAGGTLALCLFSLHAGAQPAAPASPVAPATSASTVAADAAFFRVFLKDGTSLVSYGEVARVGDRIVFSMPTTTAGADPDLQLVNLPADRVDWDHTTKYAESARASRYLATQAAADYVQVSNEVAQALNGVAGAGDPAKRLALVEKARTTLAAWPAAHFNYKQDEIKQMLGMLDEAIADLRAAAGLGRFDLTFVTGPNVPVPNEPLLPRPTPKEEIEGVLTAAKLTDSSAERSSLLSAALDGIQKNSDQLPSDWAAATTAATVAIIAKEETTDHAYQSLTTTMLSLAKARTKAADVRGLQRLIDQIHARDQAMGGKRPESVQSLVDSVEAQLDVARRLQLLRDQWALRAADYRKYRLSILTSLNRFAELKTSLENIKALSGSSPFALSNIERTDAAIRRNLEATKPPDELQETHSLLSSAVEMADAAAHIRREAALTASITRAWDASAAAAGALMLVARARDELTKALQVPQLSQLSALSEASK
jgi:hypothetical protein